MYSNNGVPSLTEADKVFMPFSAPRVSGAKRLHTLSVSNQRSLPNSVKVTKTGDPFFILPRISTAPRNPNG